VMSGGCTLTTSVQWEAAGSGADFTFGDTVGSGPTAVESRIIAEAPPVGTDYAYGTWTISAVTPTSVPEPGAFTLLFANLAVVALLARKRIALGYRQYMRTTCEPPPSH
jgi:hypothetical protein